MSVRITFWELQIDPRVTFLRIKSNIESKSSLSNSLYMPNVTNSQADSWSTQGENFSITASVATKHPTSSKDSNLVKILICRQEI